MEEEKKMEVDDPEVISLNDDSSSSSSSSSHNSSTNDTSQLVEPTTPKADKSLNKSSLDKLNESASLSASKSVGKSNEKMDKNLKLQIRLENEKKRLEEKEKKEREKKEREEKRLKREEEIKKKRQEEEELKKKRQQEREKQAQEKAEREKKLAEEKAEREKKRLEQLNAKNEEKKKREEERKKQEEEKKKQEEEKQKEEDEKRRKEEKIKSHFVNYFIKKDPPTSNCGGEKSTTRFMPFQPKPNMYIAPLCRRQDVLAMTEEEHEEYIRALDEALFNPENKQKNGKLYLDEIKENKHLIRKQMKSYRKNTLPKEEKCASDENSNDVLEVKLCDVANIQTKFKVKFLLFDPKHYRRPPYYGTWRKKSKAVNGRRPFGKDEKHFNYEIDSDDEWEDEPADAESIADSDKGDEEDEMVDDEDDDGFFVPHGHLSDDELDEEDRLLDADTKKAREDAKNQMWETERKKGYKVLIPKSYFVPICSHSNDKIKLKNEEIKFFEQYQIVPIATSLPITINNEVANKVAAAAAAAAAGSDETVPKSASKPPKASKSKQIANANLSINSQTPGSPQIIPTSVTNSPNSTPSIIKFISKVSKKNIICNLEQINPPLAAAASSSTSTSTSTATTTNADTPNKLNLLNSPSQVSKMPIHVQNTPSSCQMNLSAVTPSPRLNPTNSNTAEKRSCSVSSSDSCVKRLKLDDTTQDRQNDSAMTNSPIAAKRPHNNEHKATNAAGTNSPNIISLFKKNELKKAAALNSIEKHENTNATSVESANLADKDPTPKNSDDQNNKENSKASLIVID